MTSTSSERRSDMVELGSMRKTKCGPPILPVRLENYVIATVNDGILLCGGVMRDGVSDASSTYATSECFLLDKGRNWHRSPIEPPMLEKRKSPAAVILGNDLWVTGGFHGNTYRASTELPSPDKRWRSFVNLPQRMAWHCIVKINCTHAFFSGGYDGHRRLNSAYIYSKQNGWQQMENMPITRDHHACTLLADQENILIAGGMTYRMEYLSSTFVFSLTTKKWKSGPSLPRATVDAQMIIANNLTYFMGGFIGNVRVKRKTSEVYRFDSVGNSLWQWSQVASLPSSKAKFGAIPFYLNECCGCNIL